MKLNFWQWIGIALLLLGVAVWLYERNMKSDAQSNTPTRSAPARPGEIPPPAGAPR